MKLVHCADYVGDFLDIDTLTHEECQEYTVGKNLQELTEAFRNCMAKEWQLPLAKGRELDSMALTVALVRMPGEPDVSLRGRILQKTLR